MYNFWVKELDCVSCDESVSLFKDYRVASGRYDESDKYNVYCPGCESVVLVDDWRADCTCNRCHHEWCPANGNVSGSDYACPDCGARYSITDAISEQGGFELKQYAVEYYCTVCDDRGEQRETYKGYKSTGTADEKLADVAATAWEAADDLEAYVPDRSIPEGAITRESELNGNDVFNHGYTEWRDMFNSRQLLCLGHLLRAIESIEDQAIRELLLLAFSDSLMFQSTFTIYNLSANKIEGTFRMNSLSPRWRSSRTMCGGHELAEGRSQTRMINFGVESHTPTHPRNAISTRMEKRSNQSRSPNRSANIHRLVRATCGA